MPTRARAGLIEQAQQLLRSVSQTRDRDRRFALADQAQALCEQAAKEKPRDPTPHIMLAQALSVADLQHPEACRPNACQRAIDELREARKLDRSGADAERIASELGLLLSRIGSYKEALVEYDRSLKLIDPVRRSNLFEDLGRSVLLGNSAETLMALGYLDRAIERYRQAETVSITGDIEWELAEWGLGVALDRDEQIEKSRQAIQRALDFDPTMSHLADDSVFFEPTGDKRYYEALGHEIAGDRELAVAAWRAFIAESPASPYVRRARAHLAELKHGGSGGPSVDPARVHVLVGDVVDLRGVRTASELRDVIQLHEDELRLCYARTLRVDPSARGEMQLQMLIDPSGMLAARAHVLMSTVDESSLGHCIELTASAWRFALSDNMEAEEVILTLLFGGK
ncbi:MAG TPA: AgmX/PglI C-terminal domain-containing protein [Polyangiales bacterium]|jgi:tetratricopeptide (TPR) repeat protein|nr:AgmX/PglI C-terminal domain-containing protein [Polyangiales bacterium]